MNRSGFTLIELLTATLVAGLTVTLAASVFTNASERARTMRERASRAESEAGILLWLREALLGAVTSGDQRGGFRGSADTLRFRTRLRVPSGWLEDTDVLITGIDGRLTIATDKGDFTSVDSLSDSSFDFLAGLGEDRPWLTRWDASTLPTAVRLRRHWPDGSADTTLLYLGHRR